MKLSCIKCHQQYETEDPDPYLCKPCNEERLAIAKQVDAQMGSTVTKRKAPSFEERMAAMPKIPGTNITIVN